MSHPKDKKEAILRDLIGRKVVMTIFHPGDDDESEIRGHIIDVGVKAVWYYENPGDHPRPESLINIRRVEIDLEELD